MLKPAKIRNYHDGSNNNDDTISHDNTISHNDACVLKEDFNSYHIKMHKRNPKCQRCFS